MNIDTETQDVATLDEKILDDQETLDDQKTSNLEEDLKKGMIEVAKEIGREDLLEEYPNLFGDITQQDTETNEETSQTQQVALSETAHLDKATNEEQELYNPKFYTLDATLIRVRMRERNLTLTDLKEQLGVAYRTVIRWLNKDDFPQHKNLVKLADVLDVEPYKLVYNTWRQSGDKRPSETNDAIRYIQRRIETIVTEILDDKETSKEKKLDALLKYHNILLKATKEN